MALLVGDSAPNFTLFSDAKEAWTLAEQSGHTLILFFPGAFTSVCTTELNSVNNDLSRYTGLNVNVVGISTDSPFSLAEFKKANALTFPLLSDHNGSVSAAYGAKYNNDFTPMKLDRISKRAAFVIDASKTIRYAEVLENAGEMPNFEAIHAAVAAL